MNMCNKLDVEHIAPYVSVYLTRTKISASNIDSALTFAYGNSGYNDMLQIK